MHNKYLISDEPKLVVECEKGLRNTVQKESMFYTSAIQQQSSCMLIRGKWSELCRLIFTEKT